MQVQSGEYHQTTVTLQQRQSLRHIRATWPWYLTFSTQNQPMSVGFLIVYQIWQRQL